MPRYAFDLKCRPRGDFREREIVAFIEVMQEALRFEQLYSERKKPFEVDAANLRALFERKLAGAPFPEIGVDTGFYTRQGADPKTFRFDIHTGTQPGARPVDLFGVTLGALEAAGFQGLPDLAYFRRSIEILRPFEAYISESRNEVRLDTFNRFQALGGFTRPVAIRWFHYLDGKMAKSIGGVRRCLRAPVWRAERFCEGVLLQLFEEPLDPDNAAHVEAQARAMEYFGL